VNIIFCIIIRVKNSIRNLNVHPMRINLFCAYKLKYFERFFML